jgi:hypothetical protein
MSKIIEKDKPNMFFLDFGGSTTSTAIPGLYATCFMANLNDEISHSEIVKKLDSLKELPSSEYKTSSEARGHLKRLMSE